MVEKLIAYFENKSFSVERGKSPIVRRGSSKDRLKELVNEFIEIKRFPDKSETIEKNSNKTFSRGSRVTEDEFSIVTAKQPRPVSRKKKPVKKTVAKDVTEPDSHIVKNEPEVKRGAEKFGQEVIRSKVSRERKKEEKKTEESNHNKSSTSIGFEESSFDEEKIKSAQEDIEDIYNFLDESDGDDMFGLNDFAEDSKNNYILEAYNEEGKELMITTLEIKRRVTSLDKKGNEINNLADNYNFVFRKNYENSVPNKKPKCNEFNDSSESTNHDYENYNEYYSIHAENETEEVSKETDSQEIYENINYDVQSNEEDSDNISNSEEQIEFSSRPFRRCFTHFSKRGVRDFYHSSTDFSNNEETIQAESPEIKNDLILAIEAKLSSQLQKAKEKQQQLHSDKGKCLSLVSLEGSFENGHRQHQRKWISNIDTDESYETTPHLYQRI